eukprot:scaffold8023_cov103-Isochrysis_galbana.AAC.1
MNTVEERQPRAIVRRRCRAISFLARSSGPGTVPTTAQPRTTLTATMTAFQSACAPTVVVSLWPPLV